VEAVQTYIALGSNLEPRAEHLARARTLLQRISEGNWQESSIRETAPVGPAGQGPYLNQVVSFLSSRHSVALLHFCKGAEIALGRKARGRWEAREIDLDLLYRGQELYHDPQLQLPHPRIAERRFVLEPMCELAPGWNDPSHGISVAVLLDRLNQSEAL